MFQEMSKVITEAFASYFAGFALSVSVLLLLFYYLDKILSRILHVYILENISVLQSEKYGRKNKSAAGWINECGATSCGSFSTTVLLQLADFASLKLDISMLQPAKLDTPCIFVSSHLTVELTCMLPAFITSCEILEVLLCVWS